MQIHCEHFSFVENKQKFTTLIVRFIFNIFQETILIIN